MASRNFIEKGAAAHLRVPYDGPAKAFYFLLLPKATMLAVAAAIEPLRIANQLAGKELYRWYTMSEDGNAITCSNGLRITPDHPLQPLPSDATGFVCAGVEPETVAASPPVLAWLRRESRHGRTLGGICTGAFSLASAGLLSGHVFTLHWENQPSFRERFQGLAPSPNLFEIDRRILTCGGGNSAIDMMLALIEDSHGPELAIMVADMCIHMRSGGASMPQQSPHSLVLGTRNPHLLAALDLMESRIEEPLSMPEICEHLDISRRQLERLFKQYMNQSPMTCYLDIRLMRAFALLRDTNMTVLDIATACGFGNASHLARRFRAKYGHPPHRFRRFWA